MAEDQLTFDYPSTTKTLLNGFKKFPQELAAEFSGAAKDLTAQAIKLKSDLERNVQTFTEKVIPLAHKTTETIKPLAPAVARSAFFIPDTAVKRCQNSQETVSLNNIKRIAVGDSYKSLLDGYSLGLMNTLGSYTFKVNAQDKLYNNLKVNLSPILTPYVSQPQSDAAISFLSGLGANGAGTFLFYPLERQKVKLQVKGKPMPVNKTPIKIFSLDQLKNLYQIATDCANKISDPKVVKSAYEGVDATVLRDALSAGIFFTIFNSQLSDNPHPTNTQKTKAAGIAALCSTAASHPLDLLKTRRQANSGSGTLLQQIADIYAKEGIAGFTRGFSLNMFAKASKVAAPFALYQLLKNDNMAPVLVNDPAPSLKK